MVYALCFVPVYAQSQYNNYIEVDAMEMDYKSLGSNIRARRALAKMTQRDLAEKVDCSERHIGQIENGKNVPSLALVVGIANALNVGIDQLVYGDLANRTDYFIQELVTYTEGFDDKDKLTTLSMIKSLIAILKEYKKN